MTILPVRNGSEDVPSALSFESEKHHAYYNLTHSDGMVRLGTQKQ